MWFRQEDLWAGRGIIEASGMLARRMLMGTIDYFVQGLGVLSWL